MSSHIKNINDGEVVIFPTDTVYGMGCKLYDTVGEKKIYKVKSREIIKELAILFSDLSEVQKVAIFNKRALILAKAFWPGALTIILQTTNEYNLKTGKKTIGVRIPNNELALSLIKLNGPLKTTSVNLSNNPPLSNIKEIKENFTNKVDYIYEETKENYLNLSSTIVDLSKSEIVILREGSISKNDIYDVLKR